MLTYCTYTNISCWTAVVTLSLAIDPILPKPGVLVTFYEDDIMSFVLQSFVFLSAQRQFYAKIAEIIYRNK